MIISSEDAGLIADILEEEINRVMDGEQRLDVPDLISRIERIVSSLRIYANMRHPAQILDDREPASEDEIRKAHKHYARELNSVSGNNAS